MSRFLWLLAVLMYFAGCAHIEHQELTDADAQRESVGPSQVQHERERADHYLAKLRKRKQDFGERQAFYEYIHSRSRLDSSKLASNTIPSSVCKAAAEGQLGKTAMAGTSFHDYENYLAVMEQCRNQSKK